MEEVDFSSLEKETRVILEEAVAAKEKSYSPYSKFRVGSCVKSTNGKLYSGCNVENASYGGTICAERTALCKAVSEGDTKFLIIAIATDVKNNFTPPCGICRQFIREFGESIDIFLINGNKKCIRTTLGYLLPQGFGLSDLTSYWNMETVK